MARLQSVGGELRKTELQRNDTDRRNQKFPEKTMSQCHFVHNKFHKHWPVIEPPPPRWQICDLQPKPCHWVVLQLNVRAPQKTHYFSITKINVVMLPGKWLCSPPPPLPTMRSPPTHCTCRMFNVTAGGTHSNHFVCKGTWLDAEMRVRINAVVCEMSGCETTTRHSENTHNWDFVNTAAFQHLNYITLVIYWQLLMNCQARMFRAELLKLFTATIKMQGNINVTYKCSLHTKKVNYSTATLPPNTTVHSILLQVSYVFRPHEPSSGFRIKMKGKNVDTVSCASLLLIYWVHSNQLTTDLLSAQ
jgi:hypothetical protein